MQEKILGWAYAVLVVAICLLALIAVLLFAWHVEDATPWVKMTAAEWGVWVGSIGTIGAMTGTIYLATAETRRRQKAELVLAHLHGAAMINRIQLAHNSVDALVTTLAKQEDVDKIPASFYFERLESLNAVDLWQVSDLVPLVPLPYNTAAKLAQAADQLGLIKRLLALGQKERMLSSKIARIATRNAILGRASVVSFQLRDAEIECRKTMVTVGSQAPT